VTLKTSEKCAAGTGELLRAIVKRRLRLLFDRGADDFAIHVDGNLARDHNEASGIHLEHRRIGAGGFMLRRIGWPALAIMDRVHHALIP
jgi:hypothetical protein